MITAFQVLLFVLMVIFTIGVIGAPDKDMRGNSVAVVIASIAAFVGTLIIG